METSMSRLLAATFATVLAAFCLPALGADPYPIAVKVLRQIKPCRPLTPVKITAYLQASRHGAWLSQDAGLNGRGVLLEIEDSLDREKYKAFFRYLYDPRLYSTNLFHGIFSGPISCNNNGVPILRVNQVESIRITPVRDARVTPNNSFKPKPLRGSA
jgi:hypothetical protein